MAPERNTSSLERPLGPRSLVASLLLRSDPPRMPGRRLVQWCGLFGVTEGTARVALSRMVDRGELRATDGVYELAGRVQRRRPAQDFSLRPVVRPWDGSWRLGLVGGGARAAADRTALRDAMRRLRCAEVREGVWARPDNLAPGAAPDDAVAVADAQCSWWTAEPPGVAAELAAALFDPEGWARRARELAATLGRATAALGRNDEALATAFTVGAATLAHIRADPLLPAELCPSPWPGDEFRATYFEYEREFSAAVQAWFRQHQ